MTLIIASSTGYIEFFLTAQAEGNSQREQTIGIYLPIMVVVDFFYKINSISNSSPPILQFLPYLVIQHFGHTHFLYE